MVLARIVPWAHTNELDELKRWFYPDKMGESKVIDGLDCRWRAIQRVKCYQSRGSQYLPHVIDSTAQITSSVLLDERSSGMGDDNFPTRLSYTMSLIRYVNGLLDPTQQSQYAIPLHTLAQKIGLPSFFVDLRHGGTHERDLPTLDMLRYVSKQALIWLWDHYWNYDELDDTDDEISSDSERNLSREIRRMFEIGKQLKNLLIEYRWVWENSTINLISSSNFTVEEPKDRGRKRSLDISPNEQIEEYISNCKALWKQCNDKKEFIEKLVANYEPILLKVLITKIKGFDQEFYSWISKSFKNQSNGEAGTLRTMFVNWTILEKSLLVNFIDSLNINLLISQWNSWNLLLDNDSSYLTLWICESLMKQLNELKNSHANKRRKKRKQTNIDQEIEKPLKERINRLSKLYKPSDKKLYALSPLKKQSLSASTTNTTKAHEILDDLANLRERMNRPKAISGTSPGQERNVKIWSQPSSWEPKAFGTV